MQDQPDQSTLSMGNRPVSLFVSEKRYRTTIDNLEDASFGPGCSVSRLVENAPHVAVALRRPLAVVHFSGFGRVNRGLGKFNQVTDVSTVHNTRR